MAFEDKCIDVSDDVFMDALEEKDNFIEEIIQHKICLEVHYLIQGRGSSEAYCQHHWQSDLSSG